MGESRELLIDRGECIECRDSACRGGGSVEFFHHKGLRGGNGSSWPPQVGLLADGYKVTVMMIKLALLKSLVGAEF